MKIRSNKSLKKVYKLFDDLNERYSIYIDDIMKMKMLNDMCNLVNREVFGLDELETFILRCRYGIYDRGIGSSFFEIGNILGISENRVNVIYIDAMNRVYEYIMRTNKIKCLGYNSIYSLDKVDYYLLEKLENKGIIYIDDLINLDYLELYELFSEFRMYLVPLFDGDIAREHTNRDIFNFMKNINELGIEKKSQDKIRVIGSCVK